VSGNAANATSLDPVRDPFIAIDNLRRSLNRALHRAERREDHRIVGTVLPVRTIRNRASMPSAWQGR